MGGGQSRNTVHPTSVPSEKVTSEQEVVSEEVDEDGNVIRRRVHKRKHVHKSRGGQKTTSPGIRTLVVANVDKSILYDVAFAAGKGIGMAAGAVVGGAEYVADRTVDAYHAVGRAASGTMLERGAVAARDSASDAYDSVRSSDLLARGAHATAELASDGLNLAGRGAAAVRDNASSAYDSIKSSDVMLRSAHATTEFAADGLHFAGQVVGSAADSLRSSGPVLDGVEDFAVRARRGIGSEMSDAMNSSAARDAGDTIMDVGKQLFKGGMSLFD